MPSVYAVVAAALMAFGSAMPAADAAPPPKADKWALLIGVNRHAGRTRPNIGAVTDVNDLREAMLRRGFRADHIMVLTDGNATAANIRSGLQWLVERSSDNGLSVFHFSGHVKQRGSTEYLWPHDNKLIADTELANYFKLLRGWAWIDFAGCEAAGFNEGVASPKRLFTASSRHNQKSYEEPRWRRSVYGRFAFEQALLFGLGDGNGDRKISIQEAFFHAAVNAPAYTQKQRTGPQHPVIFGGDGREWFLEI